MPHRSFPTLAAALVLSFAIPVFASEERGILLRVSFAAKKANAARSMQPKRSRFVEPDLTVLGGVTLRRHEQQEVARRLTVALFDDKVLHIELERVERNAIDAVIWSGHVEGDSASAVTLVVKEKALVASISTLEERYAIEPTEDGTHEVLEIDPAAFPDESEPMRVASASRAMATASLAPGDVVANDTAAFADILVVYTDDVRASLGGTAAAQAAATSAIAASNTAYQNSGVTMRLRLAGTAETSFAETGDVNAALNAVRSSSDGQMDEVHGLRDQLGADAVVLLVQSGGGCGVAFMMTSPSASFASNAYGTVVRSCAVGNLSFPHELGHNFGLNHDRFVASGGAAYPYAYGYVDTNDQFRDIMAYSTACGSCPRIQYFSNPLLTYLGRPLGVSYESSPSTSADNVRALNNAAPIIANWRQSVIGGGYVPPTFTDNPLVAGVTPLKALHITELRAAINLYRASVSLGNYAWTPAAVNIGDVMQATTITQMRTALSEAIPGATYTNPLTVGTPIAAIPIQELRNYLD